MVVVMAVGGGWAGAAAVGEGGYLGILISPVSEGENTDAIFQGE